MTKMKENDMRKIDWFAIDMNAMEQEWNAYLEASEVLVLLQADFDACQNGECNHERPLRKDGRPHKGRPCPSQWRIYDELCKLSNSLTYEHYSSFWESVGLDYETYVKGSLSA